MSTSITSSQGQDHHRLTYSAHRTNPRPLPTFDSCPINTVFYQVVGAARQASTPLLHVPTTSTYLRLHTVTEKDPVATKDCLSPSQSTCKQARTVIICSNSSDLCSNAQSNHPRARLTWGWWTSCELSRPPHSAQTMMQPTVEFGHSGQGDGELLLRSPSGLKG